MVTAARKGFLIPASHRDFPEEKDWPAEWLGSVKIDTGNLKGRPMGLALAWFPYVLLPALLVLSRTNDTVKGWLNSLSFNFNHILGEAGVSAGIQPLYLPGGLLLLVALIAALLQSRSLTPLGKAIGESGKTLVGAGFVLLFTVPMVRIFINSGVNAADIASMPVMTANFAAELMGGLFPAVSGVIGALGAFIAGSNTVSNLMLAQNRSGPGAVYRHDGGAAGGGRCRRQHGSHP